MADKAVSCYLKNSSSKPEFGVLDFFKSRDTQWKESGSLSAAWIRGVNNLKNLNMKRKLKTEWEATSKARKHFWRDLELRERDEAYCSKLEETVVEDKLNVARQHTDRIRSFTTLSSSERTYKSAVESTTTSSIVSTESASSTDLSTSSSSPALNSSSTFTISSSTGKSESFSKKPPSLEEPWQTLQDFAHKVALKRPVSIVEVESGPLTDTREGLFRHAYDSLILYNEDGEDPMRLKDAFVALSCTLNLSGPDIKEYFSEDILDAAHDDVPALKKQQADVATVLKPFLKTLIDSDMNVTTLLTSIIQKKAELVKSRNTLQGKVTDIVEYLCELIISPEVRAEEAFSEAEVVGVWKGLLKILLRETDIYSKSGETVIIASKGTQVILNREFGDHSPYGRKADMLFKSRTELCNFEFKSEGASPSEMMTQNRKNIRLNRCILEHLRLLGVSRPRILFADFAGFSGCIFSLQAFQDIYTSKCVDYMSVPRNVTELKELLEEGDLISSLLNIMESLVETDGLASEALDKQAQAKTKRKLLDLYGSRDKTPPQRERRFSTSIYLSPNK